MRSSANTPHPWSFDRRRAIIGIIVPDGRAPSGFTEEPVMRLSILLASLLLVIPLAQAYVHAQGGGPAGPPFSPAVTAGDFVYLSGMLPTGRDGTIAPGDIRAQTARALDNLAVLLKKHGSRMEQVASVTVYLEQASDFPAMNEVYARYWPKDPPTRTTVVANLLAPGALVEIAMVALKDGVERRVIHPAGWMRSPNPYSYGIKSKHTLFLSGLIARNGKDNSFGGGDMTAQTRAVLQNARAILSEAGMSLADVVASRVYITDTTRFQDMNAAYREGFPANPPARATVRCGLTGPQYLVEITMVAVQDPSRQAFTTPAADGSPGKPNPVLSSAIRVGDRLFLSGMLGSTEDTKGNAGAQTKETLARLGRTLETAGFGWKDVVESVVYLPDLANAAAMNEAYRSALAPPYPARATIEAGLVAPDGLVEIMMTAVKRR
jgi:enamine deaminase RidA (YjgF/YER057c/UK114 family)